MFARDMLIATHVETYGLRDYGVDVPSRGADVPLLLARRALPAHLAVGANTDERRAAPASNAVRGSGRGARGPGRWTPCANLDPCGAATTMLGGVAARARGSDYPGVLTSGGTVLVILAIVAVATAIDVATQAQGRVALCVTAATLLSVMALDA